MSSPTRGSGCSAPAHFFDNAFAGSAHGVEKGGLTGAGREMIRRMEARSMLVDVAHASSATVDDVLAIATRPVVASHTGLRGHVDNARNLTDARARGIADSGGVLGIGFWPTVCGGDTATDIARAISQAIGVAGVEHVASAPTSTAPCRCRSTPPASCCSRTPCSTPVSTTMRWPEGHGRQRPPAAGRHPALTRPAAGRSGTLC